MNPDSSWETRYKTGPRLFSGDPNPTLITEVSHLPADRALDIGCGEGADAIWLAQQGWNVTALDVAPTALHRAAQRTSSNNTSITWVTCDINQDPLPEGPYTLVTMHYVPLLKKGVDRALPGILNSVVLGGTILFVTHDISNMAARDGFEPRDYCQPNDIAQRLGREWTVTLNERRPRNSHTQDTTTHTHDAILSATRRAT
ncbi:class I SAM-dependent methyltransferase [Arthrobacter zhaoguopingii]|uniref:class I SAM-dependent methyltransferase n=1 Tax=Arthrobacter zhaoguopingii TaxID=2681491 RepID=UPI0013572FB9|nr:class I SAM-dependent methyltransferase [Arthrobacter zhaoguopingii]